MITDNSGGHVAMKWDEGKVVPHAEALLMAHPLSNPKALTELVLAEGMFASYEQHVADDEGHLTAYLMFVPNVILTPAHLCRLAIKVARHYPKGDVQAVERIDGRVVFYVDLPKRHPKR